MRCQIDRPTVHWSGKDTIYTYIVGEILGGPFLTLCCRSSTHGTESFRTGE